MYSIIILDDEEIVRLSISRYIQSTQPEFQIRGTFSCGADAITYIKDNPVDVIISDIRMSGIDGLALAKYVHENLPETIVVLVTAYGEFDYAQKALRHGVFNYLLKPLNFAELTETLERIKLSLASSASTLSDTEKDIQIFFYDVINGFIPNLQAFDQRFSSMALGLKGRDYAGCFLTIIPDNYSPLSRQHPPERQAIRMLQAIRRAFPEYQCYYLFHVNALYLFVILSAGQPPAVSPSLLAQPLLVDTHISCEVRIHTEFSSIHELYLSSMRGEKASPTDLQLSDNLDTVIPRAINFIAEHFADNISREDVADAVFLSPAYFSRFFKQKTGMSFIDYVTKVRMEKAIELLSTNKRIGDIAKQVGYLSRNRFSINFRQYTGRSPSEYRHVILKMEDNDE